jgi:hypothetical protein
MMLDEIISKLLNPDQKEVKRKKNKDFQKEKCLLFDWRLRASTSGCAAEFS